ncbi:alcohol dehydrogenase [Serendipita vermifera]|nr:alcohol dehydrogenase [Serendipita vermifera]
MSSSQLPPQYTRLTLRERPTTAIDSQTFAVERVSTEDLKNSMKGDDVLVRVDYVSLDPAMRGWLNDRRSYMEPIKIGAVMRATGQGTILAVGSEVQGMKPGDIVEGSLGWTEYTVQPAKALHILPPPPKGADPLDYLGVLGFTGITAYFGITDVAQLKEGETLVVSGAAGATGSVVCQLGKLLGAKVVAIAGSEDKCQWLENDLGVDKALNYKSPTFVEDFKKAVGYLDVYFDNVGGEILDLCLGRLNKHARVALCGAISAYNEAKPRGIHGYLNLIAQGAKIQGFILTDYASRYGEARAQLSEWMAAGKLKRKFHIREGLERAPEYLNELFAGKNTGKMLLKVSPQAPTPKL